jgi:hypothetical protein
MVERPGSLTNYVRELEPVRPSTTTAAVIVKSELSKSHHQ